MKILTSQNQSFYLINIIMRYVSHNNQLTKYASLGMTLIGFCSYLLIPPKANVVGPNECEQLQMNNVCYIYIYAHRNEKSTLVL